ncbi:Os05g0488800 protein, related [Neospora caninum Liverpool]|uniref:Os05g0488800 protein, related n=1 Tax=Neospora caninum (strain Liverpool) TaxID=572307 RepID=F0VCL6_NEOCL|nr:Os05g0488800 protein, related [Neospora caninum Liverpool]CBZ51705.1 Os05g0488800 protein, related [Neospora caninum Liverpool]CEL65657.1 TPA: Os05g0488800 protein, related [Neospora caninum Liverpool]|eukprot:XP_003881738.1 Os05g0488800 protein, related [Neospora caninum Liverpool]
MGNNNSRGGGRPGHAPGGASGASNFVSSHRLASPASSATNPHSNATPSESPIRGHCYACDARGPATLDSASGDLRCDSCGAVGFVERLADGSVSGSSAPPSSSSGVPSGPTVSVATAPAAVVENAFGIPVADLMAQLIGGLAELQSDDPGMFFYGDGEFEHAAGGRPSSTRSSRQGGSLCPRVVFGSEQERQQQEDARRMMQAVFGTTDGPRAFGGGVSDNGAAQNAVAGQAPFIQIGNLVMQVLNQALSGGAGFGVGEEAMDQILTMIMQNDVNRYGSPPAAASVIRSLREETLTEEQAREAGPCAICQEDYRREDVVHRLTDDSSQCSHIFHRQCIIPWLEQHNSCPVCRFELPTDDAAYNQRRAELRNRVRSTLSSVAAAATNPSSSSPAPGPTEPAGGEGETVDQEAEGRRASASSSRPDQEATEGERGRDGELQASEVTEKDEEPPSVSASAPTSSATATAPSSSSSSSSPRSAAYSWVAGGSSSSSSSSPAGASSSSSASANAHSGGRSSAEASSGFPSSQPFQAFSFSTSQPSSSSGPRHVFPSSPPFFGVRGGFGLIPGVVHSAQFPAQFFPAAPGSAAGASAFGSAASGPPGGPGGQVFEATVGFDDPEAAQQQVQAMMQQIFTGLAGGPLGPQREQDEGRSAQPRRTDSGGDGCRQQ